MRVSTGLGALFSGLFFLFTPCPARSSLVYDNTGTEYRGFSTFTALWQGDEVRLASAKNNVITKIDIGVNMQSYPGVATIQLRLFGNDGDQGAPGSLLWESLPKINVPLSGGSDLISFDVQQIIVPDVFTWVAKFTEAVPVAAGLPVFGDPTIGFSPDYGWFGDGPSGVTWTKLPQTSFPPPNNVKIQYLARVHAVPAPIPFFGVVALLACRRRLRRRVNPQLDR